MGADFFPGAPYNAPEEVLQKLKQDPEYLAVRKELEKLRRDKATKPLIREAKEKTNNILMRLKDAANREYRDEWIKFEGGVIFKRFGKTIQVSRYQFTLLVLHVTHTLYIRHCSSDLRGYLTLALCTICRKALRILY
jgi:hypothetical protein